MSGEFTDQKGALVSNLTERFRKYASFGFKRGFFNWCYYPWPSRAMSPAVFSGTRLFNYLIKPNEKLNEAQFTDRFKFLDHLIQNVYEEESRLIEKHCRLNSLGLYSAMVTFLGLLALTVATSFYSEPIAGAIFISCFVAYQIAGWKAAKQAQYEMAMVAEDPDPKTYLPWFQEHKNVAVAA